MELKKYRLDELATVEISGVDKKIKENETPVKLCNFTDVYYNWAITKEMADSFMEASASQKEIDSFTLKKGQVAFTKDSETRDDIGVPTYIADDFENVVLGYHTALVTPDKNKLSGKYLNAFMNSKYIQKYFENNASGSGQRYTLSNETLNGIPVLAPDLPTQEKIGDIFSNIDRKIALNRRMNAKLEQMAKRLYDHWFVQFDFPNAAGKPYKASGGKMVWNEKLKCEIPDGWEVKKLDELLDCNKYSITTNSNYEFISYLDTSSLTENQISSFTRIERSEKIPSRAKRIIKKNDILYSTVRPSQCHFGIIKNPVENMIASTGFAVMSCKMGSEYNEIFYQFITSSENINRLDSIANLNASSYPSINPSDILDLQIALPTNITELRPLIKNLSIFYTIIELNQKETAKLVSLRSHLLPLLMNGQVEVK